jgi:fermentation-respiration switch protein FrsA (DUF1100 family)
LGLAGCTASPEINVLSHRLARITESLRARPDEAATGSIVGVVLIGETPVAGATVVIAEPDGAPHNAVTGDDGRYRLENLPTGLYAVAAVAPGAEEGEATGLLGLRRLMLVTPGATTTVPPIILRRHLATPLPVALAQAVKLHRTDDYTVTSSFPPGAQADVTAWQFERDGVVVDTLRLYRPAQGSPQVESGAQPPLLFIIYPSHVDGWQPVSVAFAAIGFTVAALSPAAERAIDFEGHAEDARTGFHLALDGALTAGRRIDEVALFAGSFSSAIMHLVLRDETQRVGAVVIVGGIANAFEGARDYYAGRLKIPPQHRNVIPALGFPNVRTLELLRLSPVYTPARLPRTLIIHTTADEVIPVSQAQALEQAARAAGIAVEAYYYDDVSHYLLIGEEMTEAGAEMFWRIVEFLQGR